MVDVGRVAVEYENFYPQVMHSFHKVSLGAVVDMPHLRQRSVTPEGASITLSYEISDIHSGYPQIHIPCGEPCGLLFSIVDSIGDKLCTSDGNPVYMPAASTALL